MSSKFETALEEWYVNSKRSNLEYLNLELPKPELVSFDSQTINCFHTRDQKHSINSSNPQLNFLVDIGCQSYNNQEYHFDKHGLFARLCLKNLKHIQETQLKQCKFLEELQDLCETLRKQHQHLAREVRRIPLPLTSNEVRGLVAEIAKQPKLVEEEALKLTSELNLKLERVEELVLGIKKLFV